MKILVTGADGQLGRCLIDKALADDSIELIALNRTSLDISNIAAVQHVLEAHKPGFIINTAAYTAVDKAESDIEQAYLVNQKGPENLAYACSEMDIPLIHISTDYVFDGSSRIPYLEQDKTCPIGVYGKSKLAGELSIQKWQKHIIVRTAWVFSEYGNNFVKTMLRLGQSRSQLSVVNDQIGCPTDALNIADALIAICKSECQQWGVYNYVGADQMSWYDFADRIFDKAFELGMLKNKVELRGIPSTAYPTPATRPNYSVLDTNKVSELYKIKTRSLDLALDRVLQKLLN